MTRWLLVALILFGGTSKVYAQEKSDEQKVKPAFSVHEWGVFTVPRGAEWLKQDMLNEWRSFPAFFHGTLPDRGLAYRGPVTKPVMFFHGKDQFQIELLIQFADGQPLIWWPPVEFPATGTFGVIEHLLPEDWKGVHQKSILRYQMQLNGSGRKEPVEKNHWVSDLRTVKSAPISVEDSYSRMSASSRIAESFLYYDGLMKPPKPPTVKRTKNGISIKTDSDHEWLDVIAIERKVDDDKQLSFARIAKIEKGQNTTELTLTAADSDDLQELIADFRKSLVESGLHEDEAQSLLDVWSDGLFRPSGLTLIYRIPQATYDRWIPLHFAPAPKEIVRVGLVVHKHLEPELDDIVARLVLELGSDEYRIRQNADVRLHEIGGAAIEAIRKVSNNKNLEVAARARQLLKNLDNEALLNEVMTRYQRKTGGNK